MSQPFRAFKSGQTRAALMLTFSCGSAALPWWLEPIRSLWNGRRGFARESKRLPSLTGRIPAARKHLIFLLILSVPRHFSLLCSTKHPLIALTLNTIPRRAAGVSAAAIATNSFSFERQAILPGWVILFIKPMSEGFIYLFFLKKESGNFMSQKLFFELIQKRSIEKLRLVSWPVWCLRLRTDQWGRTCKYASKPTSGKLNLTSEPRLCRALPFDMCQSHLLTLLNCLKALQLGAAAAAASGDHDYSRLVEVDAGNSQFRRDGFVNCDLLLEQRWAVPVYHLQIYSFVNFHSKVCIYWTFFRQTGGARAAESITCRWPCLFVFLFVGILQGAALSLWARRPFCHHKYSLRSPLGLVKLTLSSLNDARTV